MSKDISLDIKSLLPKIKKAAAKFTKHLSFVILMLILLVYLYVIWQVKGLVTAEPSDDAQQKALTSAKLPKIDQKAIGQIQSLEQNNTDVQSLFNEARNNPFNE